MELFWLLPAILVLLAVWLVFVYNGLIKTRNRVDESWSDIEVQMKRRYDLIPNLVESVKAYARHEDSVFTKVSEARAAAMGATSMKEHAQAENQLSQTLKSLFAVSESYPQLRASDNFLDLQRNLTDAEDKIQAARRFYNGMTRDFNTKLQVFPTNLIAGTFGFVKREYYDAPEVVSEVPVVKF